MHVAIVEENWISPNPKNGGITRAVHNAQTANIATIVVFGVIMEGYFRDR